MSASKILSLRKIGYWKGEHIWQIYECSTTIAWHISCNPQSAHFMLPTKNEHTHVCWFQNLVHDIFQREKLSLFISK